MQDMLQAWQQAGATLTLPGSGLQVYYRDIGDAGAAPADTALLMHGFPESSFSYHKVVDGLGARFKRVVLLDLIGYGFSDKPSADRFGYSLMEQ